MRGLSTRHQSMRAMLEELGVRPTLAKAPLQIMRVRPQSSDRDAAGVQILVRAIQRTLKRKGHPVKVTGWIDERTTTALDKVSGPHWNHLMWMQVVEDVLESKPARHEPQPAALAGYEPSGGVLTEFFWSPTGLLAVGALAWYFARRR